MTYIIDNHTSDWICYCTCVGSTAHSANDWRMVVGVPRERRYSKAAAFISSVPSQLSRSMIVTAAAAAATSTIAPVSASSFGSVGSSQSVSSYVCEKQ